VQAASWVDAHGPYLEYTVADLSAPPTDRWYQVVELTSNGFGDASAWVSPDGAPADLGNVIRAVKEGVDVRLQLYGANAASFRIYRDPSGPALGTTFLTASTGQDWRDLLAIDDPQSFYYAVRGVSCTGLVGP
jgi:hypothetical protein